MLPPGEELPPPHQPPSEEDSLREVADEARSCLRWLLAGMGIEAGIETFIRDGQILLNVICGSDSSIVIGRKGQTLEAIQFLVGRIVSKGHDEARWRSKIVVDTAGYRERRRSNLIDHARRACGEVRDTGEPSLIGPFNSYERYILHSALKDEEGIVAVSEGQGPLKSILISPLPEGDG